ncbi:MAG: hypothetical protein ACI8QC_002260 [Planctomycetota bacterium]|jgi:hypothetical protein
MMQRCLLALALSASASAQVNIGPAVRVDTGGNAAANETSVAISPAAPLRLLSAWNDYRVGNARLGVSLSEDGGTTWLDQILRPPLAHQTVDEGDPMTAFDGRTGKMWAGGIAFGAGGGVFVAALEFGASAFTAPVMAKLTAAADKGWMAAGPDPLNPGASLLHIAYNQGLITSADEGQNWSSPLSLGSGFGFLPRVGSAGELYVSFWSGGPPIFLWRSFDGGQSMLGPTQIANRMDFWTDGSDRVPGDFRVPPLPSMAVDPTTGDLHTIFCDTTDVTGLETNLDLYWTTSTDQGLNWSTPVVIHGDSTPTADQFFPWLEIDADGRLHVVWFDTRHNAQLDADPAALIDVHYAYSEDSGQSWSEQRITTSSFSSANDGFSGTFMGDYLGLATAGGRTLIAYPDTSSGDPDLYVHSIVHGTATSFCFGIACPCGNEDPSAGCGNSGLDGLVSTGGLLTVASGTASIAADDLVLRSSGLGTGQFGLMFTSLVSTRVPFGAGVRCIDGPFYRYPLLPTNPAGELDLGPGQVIGISQSAFGPLGQVASGATWNYQAWYRDPFGPCGATFNTTNALAITWQ